MALSLTLVIGFLIGFGRLGKNDRVIFLNATNFQLSKHLSYILIAFGCVLYVVFLLTSYDDLTSVYSIDRRTYFKRTQGLGFLVIGLNIMILGIVLGVNRMFVAKNKNLVTRIPFKWVILFGLVSLHIFILGNRKPLLLIVLPILVLLIILRPKVQKRVISLAPLMVFVLLIFGVIRGLASEGNKVDFLLHTFDWRRFDPTAAGELATHNTIDRDVFTLPNLEFRYGVSYIDGLVSLVPEVIFPNRPESLAEWYARSFHHSVFEEGGGFGFSLIAESYINFGVFGPFLIGLILGLVLKRLYLHTVRHSSIIMITLWGVILYYIFLLPRSGISPLLKEFLIGAMLPLMFFKRLAAIMGVRKRHKVYSRP